MATSLLRRRIRERSAAEDAAAFISGLLFGGAVAAGAAILFAPSDGATFRARLTRRVNELLGTGPDDLELENISAQVAPAPPSPTDPTEGMASVSPAANV